MKRGLVCFCLFKTYFYILTLQLPTHRKRASTKCTEGLVGKDTRTLKMKKKKKNGEGKGKMLYFISELV